MKEFKKVWSGTYVGRHFMAPKHIQVKSIYTSGGPVWDEIKSALLEMGYSESEASSITGALGDWKFT